MQELEISRRSYEAWLRDQLDGQLAEGDLSEKHKKMREGAFVFLRATYWRWSETILEVCPELAGAPEVLAIGDTHLENFGTWRDIEGRLVWGANDFDDAAPMPYVLDLVRLATSAMLARTEHWRQADAPSNTEISHAILTGYEEGLKKPAPIVLDRNHPGLRNDLLLDKDARRKFWDDADAWREDGLADAPPNFAKALRGALPEGFADEAISPRTAGTGSLGRPRFVVQADWRGGPVLREAKALVPSGWAYAHGNDGRLYVESIATGRARAPDPHYRVVGSILVRRLSPNSRKIEAKTDPKVLLKRRMLELMGHELANCHAESARAVDIRRDLSARDPDWLRKAAKAAAEFVAEEQRAYAARAGDE